MLPASAPQLLADYGAASDRRDAEPPSALGQASQHSGLAAAVPELLVGEDVVLRSIAFGTFRATLAPGVSPALVLECLAERRPLLVECYPGKQPVVLGAIQTTPTVRLSPEGDFLLRARRVRIEASDGFQLTTPSAGLSAEGSRVRLHGDRLTANVASHVKVLSALVELP